MTLAATMKRQNSFFNPNVFKFLVVCSSIAWGLLEFLALQRSRFHAWKAKI
jgi:hypothetical protein